MIKYIYPFLLLLLVGCARKNESTMLWSEEFNYKGKPDPQIWSYDTKGNAWNWGNNELQYYTDSLAENAYVSNGSLKIIALKDSLGGKGFSSARLITYHKMNFNYGRLEIRAKLPTGRGIWPAIWMLGTNIEEVGWPLCGEIDIMEYVGYQPDSVYGTIHSETYNHLKNTQKMNSIFIEKPDAFNVYAVEWSSDNISFFCNDVMYNSITRAANDSTAKEWPFDKPFYLLLNVAVGGNWGGKYGVDDSIFPATMEVDYIRLFSLKN